MINTSHQIHTSIIDLKSNDKSQASDLAFGNKTAVLCGDFLLYMSCTELAGLKDQDVVELMSSALADLSQSEFIGLRDKQNNIYPENPMNSFKCEVSHRPTKEFIFSDHYHTAKKQWEMYHTFKCGNILGKACKGTLKLGGHSKKVQNEGLEFGKSFALAWQASKELQEFKKNLDCFSLFSAPVLFHLQFDNSLYDEIRNGCDNVEDINYDIVRKLILEGPGLESTEKLLWEHSEAALKFLDCLPNSEACRALVIILEAMRNM